ncbi:hypothetical protein [Sediminispirochaeta bajacaliforniensis]|uniref:hypothetical protein n=1 Tax=Sediminispirochaeta bajacaliforniensis TaxID=148 RepID=UPI000368EF90|nr:hypothetical protein [Sediminispirochaeta bajacaliforniensis]
MKGPVILDEKTGEVVLNLPDGDRDLGGKLKKELFEVFAFEALDRRTVRTMNRYARSWLAERGVTPAWEREDEE